ncbi:hypothetical protein [Pseudoxanthomonas sp.]|uniref:hypothetical protein n=1 Tax=Pseudoxanthomonas sp. TaxID=1871049 RepID=UPI0025DC0EB1|nr:hypothetical protein [Pseudoxanthomonas sp.]
MSAGTSIRDNIRDILDKADDSLTARQIFDRLQARGVRTAGASAVAASMRTGEIEGCFVKSEIGGLLHWSNHPEWTGKTKRLPRVAASAKVEPAVDLPPPQLRARPQRIPPPPIDPPEDEPTASIATPPAPSSPETPVQAPPAKARKPPFALVERLDAIAQDLQDALDDACKAELPHTLIAALVAANNATQLAARRLVA